MDCATAQMSGPVTLTTADFSEGGVFLKTEFPLDPGTRFGCRFHLDEGAPVLAEAEVAWVRSGPPEATPPPGMGVRFVQLDQADAARVRAYVEGIGGDASALHLPDDASLPQLTLRLQGVGSPLPGEFRAMNDTGLSAVAELPFLKVGSQVQVSIVEAGEATPRAGRIAWLALESDEEDEQKPPRIRLGIHFQEGAVAGASAPADEPIPLTTPKTPLVMASAPVAVSTLPAAKASAGFEPPWQIGDTAQAAARPAEAAGTRRRVRGRQAAAGVAAMGAAFQSLRARAMSNPRLSLMVLAGAGVLLFGLVAALAFSGGKKKPTRSPAAPTAPAEVAVAPLPAAPPAAGAPAVGPTQAAAGKAGAAPPLPGAPGGNKDALADDPNAQKDPGKVLADGKGAEDPLADPKAATKPAGARTLHSYNLGNQFVVKLAVSGKPTKVSHYLLANPNGVVVDVAGVAPTVAPGKYTVKDGRVKSVRVVNRGQAARFIVHYAGKKPMAMRLVTAADAVNFVLSGASAGSSAADLADSRPAKGAKGVKGAKGKPAAGAKVAKTPAGKPATAKRPPAPARPRPRTRPVPPVAEAGE
jgi:uncharacterized protein (TIGR02266 family)